MALKQATRRLAVDTPLGQDVLVLTSFAGYEAISRPFSYQLDLTSDNNTIAAAQIVGHNVTIRVELADGSCRHFNGFVSRFFAGDENLQHRRNYRAEVVPWLWFLTRTSDCRIFQHKSAPDVIQHIFKDLGFSDFQVQLKSKHPQREYCVQYRETDFNFVSRLMEEEGIFYYFKHEQGKHTLVLADQKSAYVDCPEKQVDYPRDPGTRAIEDHLNHWEHRYEFRSGKWAQTDYNFADHPARGAPSPAQLMMTHESTTVNLPNAQKFEFYDYPGTYAKKDEGESYTKLRMEEEEREYDVVQAASNCRTFFPGGKFKVRHHTSHSEEGKGFVITAIQHAAREAYETGESAEFDYHNSFTCIPDTVVFRPERSTPRPRVQGVQPAVVTGPPGEEIYPDQYGRVKVQFFWDREGKRDENSSCWVRVSQMHAGKGWGYMDLPRIGEEVIVDFVEGDPDRPIITGRVYNGDNMPPFALPGMKTRRGNTTKTYKGAGYNEMSMDDTPGKEQIRIHGQYNMDSVIENNLTEHVKVDRTRNVDHNETMTIGNNQALTVGVNKTVQVGSNHSETVGANQTVNVGANQSTNVASNQSTSVGNNQSNTVGMIKNEMVGVNSNELVGVAKTTSVGVAYALTVGGMMNTAVGFMSTEEVGMNKTINVGSKFEIVCGASKITMESSGKIMIQGTDVTMQAGAGKVNIAPGGIITIKGPMTKINC